MEERDDLILTSLLEWRLAAQRAVDRSHRLALSVQRVAESATRAASVADRVSEAALRDLTEAEAAYEARVAKREGQRARA